MDNACSLITGAALGAGLMYVLDPQTGRRRRALARDKMISLGHQAADAGAIAARDITHRAQGLAAGDWSVLAGGRRALNNPLRGRWSPAARSIMTLFGTTM